MALTNPRPTDLIEDEEVRDQVTEIQEGARGNPLILDTAPTAAVPQIQANESGLVGGKYYLRIGNTILVFTPGSTITVT